MHALEISCFGPFSAALGGVPLTAFESSKVRGLLVCLAVEPGQPHPRSLLADLFWPEQSEESARRSLSQALYNLRHVLGERAASLTIAPDGIRLALDEDDHIDVVEFSRLVRACDQHPHHYIESCPSCQERLQAAAGLYRGEFLESFSLRDSAVFDEWLLLRREAYHQDARRAFASLAAGFERQGRTRDALQSAHRLAELDPYDDGACQTLMRLLAASAQRPEALVVYERFRRSLQDELDVEPDAQTSALYERLRQQKEDEAALPDRYTNLPASLSPIIGREVELAQVQQRLLDPSCRLLTILGPGGSGKSRLALEAARGLLDRFAGGVFLVPLSPIVSKDSLIPAISSAVDLQLRENRPPLLQLQDYLRGKELLIVLDGCEGLLDEAPLFLDLLGLAPDLKLLATTRARLNVAEEQVFSLSGLPGAAPSGIQDVASSPAVRLFTNAARRTRPEFVLDGGNAGAVAAICADVQGMPLAILLAAAWVEVLSPADILVEMHRSLDFLQAEWADLPARQRSMRLTFDYSWSLLDDRECSLFQGLCVFRGAFSRQAAESVAGADAAGLRRLVDKSLLIPLAGDWYAVHDLLRQYALEKLQQDTTRSDLVHTRYSQYYLDKLVEWEAGLVDARQIETLALMSPRVYDLRSAWLLGCQRGDVARLNPALRGICLYYELSNRLAEGRSLCQDSLAHLQARQTPAECLLTARLRTWLARFQRLLGEMALASQSLAAAQILLDGLQDSGLDLRHAWALFHLEAAEQVFTSDLSTARRHLQLSLELYRSLGDAWRTAQGLYHLGTNYHLTGEYSTSDQLLNEAIALYKQLGLPAGVANAQRMQAQTLFRTGKAGEALVMMYQVIQVSQASGDKIQVSQDMRALAVALFISGRAEEALPAYEQALSLAEEMGVYYEITFINTIWGLAEQVLGSYASARLHLLRGLELAHRHGYQREQAACLFSLGCIAVAESAHQEERRCFQQSIALYRQVGHNDELAWALSVDAASALACGETDQALACIHEALQLMHQTNSYLGSLYTLSGAALWLAQHSDLELALEVYTLVSRQPAFANSPWHSTVFGEPILACTASLDLETAESARQRGCQRPIWDTVAELKALLS
jgi:DNA-binding SARP family transcriptional activator/predicted ATPase